MPPSSSLSFSFEVVAPVHVPATSMSPSFAPAAGASSNAAPIAAATTEPIILFTVKAPSEIARSTSPRCPQPGPGHNGTLVVELPHAS